MENDMATFVLTLDWTDQGIRNLREAPKRSEAAKVLAKKVGVEIKEVYLTIGARQSLNSPSNQDRVFSFHCRR